MQERSGPFWDGVQGRAPIPPAAATLGFEFIDADVEAGTIEVAFRAGKEFTNPAGNVLGGFVAAMLYDTVGPALLATLEPDRFQSTLQLQVRFLRPVRPGRITGKGRVVHRDGTLVFPGGNAAGRRRVGDRHRHRPSDPAQPCTRRTVTSINGSHDARAAVALAARDTEALKRVAEEIGRSGRHVIPRVTPPAVL